MFLQETHADYACETLWEKEWGGDILWNHGTARSKGAAIAFKRGLKHHADDISADNQARLLLVDVNIENRNFCPGAPRAANGPGTNFLVGPYTFCGL